MTTILIIVQSGCIQEVLTDGVVAVHVIDKDCIQQGEKSHRCENPETVAEHVILKAIRQAQFIDAQT